MDDDNRRLSPSGHFSPLRYPGGKGKLARFVAEVVRLNRLSDGLYVEPYAGGAAVAWELLLSGVVRRVAINDLNSAVYAFWKCAIDRTDELVDLIERTPVDMHTRDRAKAVLSNPEKVDELELGFATFFLNRTNRSGILNGGVIGGRAQTGEWKIDARYTKPDLIRRIRRIAAARRRISLTNLDAVEFLKTHSAKWKAKTLVYLDPPYYEKGRHLYYDFYQADDHASVAAAVHELSPISWMISYDDTRPIHCLYPGEQGLRYTVGYSARGRAQGREAMFFSVGLKVPPVEGSMVEIERWNSKARRRAPTPKLNVATAGTSLSSRSRKTAVTPS
jgi:DNA adenine methylase